nr:NADH-quinone oxidoreductase subunit N [Acidobacteriota bacterium]
GLVIYIVVYTFMNVGAFGVIISLRRRGIVGDEVEDLAGLGQKSPGTALMMAIFMLSLGGLPVTGGFIGKWFLFGGLILRGKAEGKNWYYWLVGWAAFNTVVSFYYYVRFIRAMYIGERVADERPLALSPALQAALFVCAVAVIFIGVYPHPLIKAAEAVISTLAPGGAVALR